MFLFGSWYSEDIPIYLWFFHSKCCWKGLSLTFSYGLCYQRCVATTGRDSPNGREFYAHSPLQKLKWEAGTAAGQHRDLPSKMETYIEMKAITIHKWSCTFIECQDSSKISRIKIDCMQKGSSCFNLSISNLGTFAPNAWAVPQRQIGNEFTQGIGGRKAVLVSFGGIEHIRNDGVRGMVEYKVQTDCWRFFWVLHVSFVSALMSISWSLLPVLVLHSECYWVKNVRKAWILKCSTYPIKQLWLCYRLPLESWTKYGSVVALIVLLNFFGKRLRWPELLWRFSVFAAFDSATKWVHCSCARNSMTPRCQTKWGQVQLCGMLRENKPVESWEMINIYYISYIMRKYMLILHLGVLGNPATVGQIKSIHVYEGSPMWPLLSIVAVLWQDPIYVYWLKAPVVV